MNLKKFLKDGKKLLGVGVPVVVVGGSYLIENSMIPSGPANVDVGDVDVSIHLCALNEEDFIDTTLASLTEQPLYKENDNIKLIVLDSNSTDGTKDIAYEYTDNVWTVPRGKLTARHTGIERDEGADIIVNADADCTYPKFWLGHILRPFSDPEVVAVHGPKLSRDYLYKVLRSWWSLLGHRPSGIFSAPNSAFRRWAYLESGGLDLTVDQYDRDGELNEEEEKRLKEKLEKVGRVEWINKGVLTSERQMPVNLADGEAVEKFRKEREEGVRF